jgi:hypothetical protein
MTTTAHPPGPPHLNAHDLIAFATRWEPFGGGDEYILPEFGLQPEQFYRRLTQLLTDHRTPIEPATRSRLKVLCHNKLGSR